MKYKQFFSLIFIISVLGGISANAYDGFDKIYYPNDGNYMDIDENGIIHITNRTLGFSSLREYLHVEERGNYMFDGQTLKKTNSVEKDEKMSAFDQNGYAIIQDNYQERGHNIVDRNMQKQLNYRAQDVERIFDLKGRLIYMINHAYLLDNNLKRIFKECDSVHYCGNGKIIIKEEPENEYYIDENYKPINFGIEYKCEMEKDSESDKYILKCGDKYILGDKNGKLISHYYDSISEYYGRYLVRSGKKYGVLDFNANTMLETQDKIEGIRGLNMLYSYHTVNNTTYTKIYDDNYKVKCDIQGTLHCGTGYIYIERDGKKAFLNAEGELCTDFIYSGSVSSCEISDGKKDIMAVVVSKKGEPDIYLDDELKEIDIRKYYLKWRSIDFGDTVLAEQNSQKALFDKRTGKYIIPFSAEQLLVANNNSIFNETTNELLDIYGDRLLKLDDRVNRIYDYEGDTARVEKVAVYPEVYNTNSKQCYVDKDGNSIFDCDYVFVKKIDKDKYVALDGENIVLLKYFYEPVALHTDIQMRINNFDIPCYSVNGFCAVVAEDLRGYGYDVVWDADARTLDLRKNSTKINQVEIPPKGDAGSVYSKIYPTDIKVTLEGKRINSYCIDGAMLIGVENIEWGEVQYDGRRLKRAKFEYDDEKRILNMYVEGLQYISRD